MYSMAKSGCLGCAGLSFLLGILMFELKKQTKETSTSRISQHLIKNFNHWRIGVSSPQLLKSAYNIPLIAAVGGGKGGVGKSIISANLGASLAKAGYRVLVIDLDIGCSNLHSHFGVAMPGKSLADIFLSRSLNFKDVILPAPVQGLAFVAGGREDQLLDTFESTPGSLVRLWEMIYACKQNYRVDIVLLDLGAGTHRHTLDFFVGSHLGLITVLPEPTSIENAYVFLKMSLQKLLYNVGVNTNTTEIAEDILTGISNMTSGNLNRGYAHFIQGLKTSYPRFVHNFAQSILGRFIGLVVNQARDQADQDIGNSMEHICQRYFGWQTRNMGSVGYHETVINALKERRLLLNAYPESKVAGQINQVATRCLDTVGLKGRV